METASRSCPDPEALAAWLDQGVDAAEREQIEAHLATCDDCRLVIARVLETQSAVREAPAATTVVSATEPARVVRFPHRKRVWGITMALATAAVLMLSLVGPLRWWPGDTGTGSKLADLAAAVGDERTVEARLTGGFSYGPLRAAVRSGGSSAASDNWTLFAAAGKIREVAAREPTAANLHALGVAHLVLGELDPAVRAFEDAIAEAPPQAQYYSDLAAAYLARARQLDRPDDLPRALDAAERAIKANDVLVEARFNRALALEALFLNDQARAAWEDYLSRDASSGWAAEARAHLQKLQQGATPGELARNNSPPPVTDTSVEAALDWLLRQGLPQWAEAFLANDLDRAAREHLHLTEYATQISHLSGDPFPIALVGTASGDTAARARQAAAIRAYASAATHFDAQRFALADQVVAGCAVDDAPIVLLCDVVRGGIDVATRRDVDVERRANAIVDASRSRNWSYPLNRGLWLAGYRLLFKGDYGGAAQPYREAYEGFSRARYLSSAGNLAVQLADLSQLAGVSADSWRWMVTALRLASMSQSASLARLSRLNTAAILNRQQLPAAALALVHSLPATGDAQSEISRAFVDITRARSALAVGDLETARESIAAARALIAPSADAPAQRLLADIVSVQADIEQRDGNVEAARASLTDALSTMGPERGVLRARAHLLRASISAGREDWREQSARDVNDAIALLKQRAASPIGPALRIEDAATALQAVAQLVSAEPSFQSPRGLQLAEQLRQVLNGTPQGQPLANESDIIAAAARQPPGTTVVTFLLSTDRLLAWVLSPSGIEFASQPFDAAAFTRLLNVLTVQLFRTPEREDLWRATLSALHDAVLRNLPHLVGATDVTIVPDGVLTRVPFGALYDSSRQQYVFERTAVRIVPNLAFAYARGDAPRDGVPLTAAAIGDPELGGAAATLFERLPRAAAEARAVARLYRTGDVIIGKEATKARVLEALGVADVVHYSGHAVASLDFRGPRLLLAGDVNDPQAALAADDLRGRLSRPVRVILAACETGASSVDRAAGLTNLSSAFLRAGARTVVGNLWPVDDTASELFFVNVHRGLVEGQSTAAAVARAQRACRNNDECRRAAPTWIGTTVYGSE